MKLKNSYSYALNEIENYNVSIVKMGGVQTVENLK